MEPTADQQPAFHVEKLYLKDLSFESPLAPEGFMDPTEPVVDFSLNTSSSRKGEFHHEVVLEIRVKVNIGDKVLFLIEMAYAGLFLVRNIPEEHVPALLAIECPSILFPYARQIISGLVTDGGFRPFILDPINFAALYQQSRRQAAPAPDA
jgi:preprotein translocase subunit SecB